MFSFYIDTPPAAKNIYTIKSSTFVPRLANRKKALTLIQSIIQAEPPVSPIYYLWFKIKEPIEHKLLPFTDKTVTAFTEFLHLGEWR